MLMLINDILLKKKKVHKGTWSAFQLCSLLYVMERAGPAKVRGKKNS